MIRCEECKTKFNYKNRFMSLFDKNKKLECENCKGEYYMNIKKNKKYILYTVIFFSTFLLEYICNENNLYFRHWLELSIIYYRYAFLIIVLLIIPIFFIINSGEKLLFIIEIPAAIFIVFILLLSTSFIRSFETDAYYVKLKGQKVIAMEDHSWGDKIIIYYVPVNIFFMERSLDFPYPYEP